MYRNWDKLLPDRKLGLYTDLTNNNSNREFVSDRNTWWMLGQNTVISQLDPLSASIYKNLFQSLLSVLLTKLVRTVLGQCWPSAFSVLLRPQAAILPVWPSCLVNQMCVFLNLYRSAENIREVHAQGKSADMHIPHDTCLLTALTAWSQFVWTLWRGDVKGKCAATSTHQLIFKEEFELLSSSHYRWVTRLNLAPFSNSF